MPGMAPRDTLLPDPYSVKPMPLYSLAPHVAVPARLAERVPCKQQAGARNRAFLHRLRKAPVCAAGITHRCEAAPACVQNRNS